MRFLDQKGQAGTSVGLHFATQIGQIFLSTHGFRKDDGLALPANPREFIEDALGDFSQPQLGVVGIGQAM